MKKILCLAALAMSLPASVLAAGKEIPERAICLCAANLGVVMLEQAKAGSNPMKTLNENPRMLTDGGTKSGIIIQYIASAMWENRHTYTAEVASRNAYGACLAVHSGYPPGIGGQ
ncbi:MAG: hypothetical protein ACYCWB_06975 [Thiobacillus sp.]